jgi:hypothetical protein
MNDLHITPLPVKFELHAYGEVYDVSNNISNWKKLELALKRDGTSGVFHQLTFPFEFVSDAYDILKSIFDANTCRAVADICLFIRRDDWMWQPDSYYAPQIFSLDFTTYERTDTKIAIETKRATLYDHLKNKGKVVYDIPVPEIKEQKPWQFDRISLENKIVFRCTTDVGERADLVGEGYRCMGVTYEKTEIGVEDKMFIQTVAYNKTPQPDINGRDGTACFMWLSGSSDGTWVYCDINISGTVEVRGLENQVNTLSLVLVLESLEGDPLFDIMTCNIPIDQNTGRGVVEWQESKRFLINKGGWGCYLLIRHSMWGENEYQCYFDLDGTMTFLYDGRNRPVAVDVFHPRTLLQTLVDRMTGTQNTYPAEIESFNDDPDDLIMMSAAESIRGIAPSDESEGAKVHTSYESFLEWMNVFGYEEHIAASALSLRKRAKGFRGDLTAVVLGEEECADLKEYASGDYLYSGVKIGYSRKDIENANVRFEFNGQHDYATDLNLSDNILELISPYRADCYGIEFLAQEREKTTTDNRADKDLFLIHVKEGAHEYQTVKNVFGGNTLISIGDGTVNDTMFNGGLNPFGLLKRNEDLIGVSVTALQFTASDANAEIEIDGQRINVDCDIPAGAGLFDPVMYDVASRNWQRLPEGERINGVVKFKYKDASYEGYISEITKNPAWEADTVWVMHKKKS